MRMPEMDGARFLAKVNEIAPQTVRMVLSGQADLESTIAAVNEGRVFRFLLKPCNSETLFGVIKNGIEQYRLVHAEKHLLENTLNATVKVLFDVLGLINPVAQRRAAQIQRYAESAAEALQLLPGMWQYHLAAMISQLGCITLPQETLARAFGGQPLSDEERRLYESHPEIAGKLLGTIPRLEAVAAMVAGQMQVPARDLANGNPATWEPEKIGAAILWAAVQFDRHISQGRMPEQAAQLVNQAAPGLPPAITQAMVKAIADDSGLVMSREVTLRELEVGMIDRRRRDERARHPPRAARHGSDLHGAGAAARRRRRRRRRRTHSCFSQSAGLASRCPSWKRANYFWSTTSRISLRRWCAVSIAPSSRSSRPTRRSRVS